MHDKLLETAKNDLKSARILYKEELYPQAVFHFQQSVEKSNKAFGLISQKITESMLQNQIGHKPLKIHVHIIKEQKKSFENYKQLMEQKIISDTSIIKQEQLKKYLKEMKNFLRQTKALEKNPEKYVKISKQELQKLIKFVEENFDKLSNIKPEINFGEEQAKSLKTDIIKMFSNMKNRYPTQYKKICETVDKLELKDIKEIGTLLYESLIILIPTYYSSLILAYVVQPHSTLSRYPKEEFSPEDFYTPKLALVELLPKLIEIQDKAVKGIEGFHKYIKEKNKNAKHSCTKSYADS